MRNFKTIQDCLGFLPDIKKIYLIGCTGAGKTSLVQQIIGSQKHSFPVTTHRRTTIAPTEYVIKKNLPFKTTILLKKKIDDTKLNGFIDEIGTKKANERRGEPTPLERYF